MSEDYICALVAEFGEHRESEIKWLLDTHRRRAEQLLGDEYSGAVYDRLAFDVTRGIIVAKLESICGGLR